MENDKMKVVLKIDAEGVYFLERNGKPLTCPYAGRMLVPGNLAGSYGITERVCGSLCPLFTIYEREKDQGEKGNPAGVAFSCGSGGLSYRVTLPDENKTVEFLK